MKRTMLVLGLALTFAGLPAVPAGAAPATLAPLVPASGEAVPGAYVVTVDATANPAAVARALGVAPRYVYTSAVTGFAAALSPAELLAVRSHPAVTAVEHDQVYRAATTQNMSSAGDPWGLDRIDQRSLPLSRTYTYTGTGSGVRIYVIDSGIDTAHSQFGGRALAVYDAFGGNGQDCDGHGTHVAGTTAATTWGVAKAALPRAVRVLDCNGNGTLSGIISAVDWVRLNHVKPAVANMSVGGGYSSTLNTAVNNLVAAGVFTAVAAGNEAQNACNTSPAAASSALTVAASTKTDARASYSNYGSCVDLYAPGSMIASAWPGGGAAYSDGTSMASPHVAGVGALYKSRFGDASSSTINSWIVNNATTNVITGNVTGTPNRLLYMLGL